MHESCTFPGGMARLSTAKKIAKLREHAGLSMAEAARLAGYATASGWQRLESEDSYRKHSYLKPDIALKAARALVGRGTPPIEPEAIEALSTPELKGSARNLSDKQPSLKEAETSEIDEVDIRAGLGGGGLVEAVNFSEGGGLPMSKDVVRGTWRVPTAYLSEMRLTADGLYLFRSIGDSMTKPDGTGILSGDILLADTKDKHPSPPGIFALDDGFGVVVKRLEFVSYSNPARLRIKSDNPGHSSQELPAAEVRVIGRCVWYGRSL